jgi:hypothetical protein
MNRPLNDCDTVSETIAELAPAVFEMLTGVNVYSLPPVYYITE